MKKIFASIALVILFLSSPASACDGDGGHFETRCRTILLAPAHYERVWYEPLYSPEGYLVRNGYWGTVYVTALYQRQQVQVWVPERRGGGEFNLGIKWNWHTW